MSTASGTAPNPKKIAVVVVHGMGEQKPMETLWGVVKALWTTDGAVVLPTKNEVFSKPDRLTGSFELRRLTTRHGVGERRVDFYEFYWAHLMAGNRLRHVFSWARTLFWRLPTEVPAYLRRYWWGGWIGLFAFAAAFGLLGFVVYGSLARVIAGEAQRPLFGWLAFGTFVALIAQTWLVQKAWLVHVLGDAARYLSPNPDNVVARQEIRKAAIDMLTGLHQSREYDRIIVIAHSLGSVIAYDALNYAWGQIGKRDFELMHGHGSPASIALATLEKAAVSLNDKPVAQASYRCAQRDYSTALSNGAQGRPPIWLVTDFVTLGSPLSKADVLIASTEADFGARRTRRELPTSPPEADSENPDRFSFQTGSSLRIPHHAAVFGPTVWTNVYFRDRLFVFGDLIGGQVGRHFGPGVLDVELPPAWRFQHVDYWKDPREGTRVAWIDALRRAVNLTDNDRGRTWDDAKDMKMVPPKPLRRMTE